jgi:hypothetical protein
MRILQYKGLTSQESSLDAGGVGRTRGESESTTATSWLYEQRVRARLVVFTGGLSSFSSSRLVTIKSLAYCYKENLALTFLGTTYARGLKI